MMPTDEEKITSSRKRIECLESEVNFLKISIEGWKDVFAKKEQELKDFMLRIERLEKQLSDAWAKADGLSLKLAGKEKECERLMREATKWCEQSKKEQQDRADLRRSLVEKEGECERLKGDLECCQKAAIKSAAFSEREIKELKVVACCKEEIQVIQQARLVVYQMSKILSWGGDDLTRALYDLQQAVESLNKPNTNRLETAINDLKRLVQAEQKIYDMGVEIKRLREGIRKVISYLDLTQPITVFAAKTELRSLLEPKGGGKG